MIDGVLFRMLYICVLQITRLAPDIIRVAEEPMAVEREKGAKQGDVDPCTRLVGIMVSGLKSVIIVIDF